MKRFVLFFCVVLLVAIGKSGWGQTPSNTTSKVGAFAKTSVSPDDYLVLGAALNHFLTLKDIKVPDIRKGANLIIMRAKTPNSAWMLQEFQAKNKVVPADVGANLRKRNMKPAALPGMKNRSPNIVADNLDPYFSMKYSSHWEAWDAVREKYPRAKTWVQPWLPGYSKNGQQALLRFWFGPIDGGATATYLLVKRNQKWTVKWHALTFHQF